MKKERIDVLVSQKLNITRAKAQALLMAGQVFIKDKRIDKAGTLVDSKSIIKIKKLFPYVSRGALKIKEATEKFNISFKDRVVCDVGSSTGGFSDFALQEGAKKIYAIDTGKGQLAQKIRQDKRVVVMEQTNIRDIYNLPEKIDIFLVDVSFISLKKVLPQLQKIEDDAPIIALVKPQFEVGKEIADKYKGVIKDPKIQQEVIIEIKDFARNLGYQLSGEIESPITGAKGNKEYLIYLTN